MDKMDFPKTFVAKGDKLFGQDKWEVLDSFDSFPGDFGVFLHIRPTDRNLHFSGKGYCNPFNNYDSEVATIQMSEMPGCCGVVVLTDLEVRGNSHKGYGEFLTEAALYAACQEGFTLAIATTQNKNRVSGLIAKALGAAEVASFTNRKTKNVIKVWTKVLPKRR
jgi:hypothetical protein